MSAPLSLRASGIVVCRGSRAVPGSVLGLGRQLGRGPLPGGPLAHQAGRQVTAVQDPQDLVFRVTRPVVWPEEATASGAVMLSHLAPASSGSLRGCLGPASSPSTLSTRQGEGPPDRPREGVHCFQPRLLFLMPIGQGCLWAYPPPPSLCLHLLVIPLESHVLPQYLCLGQDKTPGRERVSLRQEAALGSLSWETRSFLFMCPPRMHSRHLPQFPGFPQQSWPVRGGWSPVPPPPTPCSGTSWALEPSTLAPVSL